MKIIVYLGMLLISYSVLAQHKTMEITNINNGKVKYIEENQRIKIRTLNRKKHVGNLKIIDSMSFSVNDKSVKIDSLLCIKKQSKGLSTVKSIVLAAGLATVASSLIAASDGNDAAFLLFTVGTGVTASAGVLEGLHTNNTKFKWRFKIVDSNPKGELVKQK